MTLAAACISKLISPGDAAAGWQALAPRRVRTSAALAWLPAAAEGVLAAGLLVPGWVGRLSPIATSLLFLGFAGALARAAERPDAGECGCFGSFSREPITRLSVVRTTSLAAVAAAAGWAGWPEPGLVRALTGASGADVVTGLTGGGLLALCLVLSLLWGRARAQARAASIGTRSAGPGEPIPDIEVVGPGGVPVLVADLRRGSGLVLLVAKAGCGPCDEILAEVPAWQDELGAGARIRIVTSSTRAEFEAEHPGLAEVTYLGALAVRRAFGVQGTPSAVLLGADGLVATPVALGPDQIRGLLAGTANAVQAHSSPST